MKFKILTSLFIFILVTAVFAASSITEDIPIDKGIAGSTSYGFNWELDDSDLENFQDTTIRFQGKDYDIHDVLVFAKDSPYLATSLTSPDDDYESNIFMEVHEDSIKYYYAFDESLRVSDATMDEPLEIEFLGKNLKITSVNANGDGFTAFVGNEYFMKVGDILAVNDKKITLENIEFNGAIQVKIGGTVKVIQVSTTELINGIEISNKEVFYNEMVENRAAVLLIGDPTIVTYIDGDAYIGEDKDYPNWVWDIDNLNEQQPTAIDRSLMGHQGPYIGIENDFCKLSDTDNPAGVGECYSLPNNYASICFDSLTVPEDDYSTLTIKYTSNEDTTQSGHPQASINANIVKISIMENGRLRMFANSITDPNNILSDLGIFTNEIWLQMFNENEIGIFYPNKNMAYVGSINVSTEKELLKVLHGNTKDENIKLIVLKTSPDNIQIKLDINGDSTKLDINGDSTVLLEDGADDLTINFGISSDEFSSLGTTVALAEREELSWTKKDYGWGMGTKNEDHRTIYGIIIRNPKSNGASDQVVLEIPADQVQANIVIKSDYIQSESETKYDINLNTGWNLFSIPLTLENTIVETVINRIQDKVELIYGYEQKEWKGWANDCQGNTLTSLKPGKGYFIKLTEPVTLHIEGTIGSGEPPVIPTFDVYKGWNLIGYYGTKDVSVSTALNNIEGNYSAVWTLFNEGIQSLQGNFKGLVFNEQLKRTHGYWLYAKEDGVIVPTN